MKATTLIPLALLTAALTHAPAADAIELANPIRSAGSWGIGFGGGSRVSGISAKYFASNTIAIQGVVGAWGYNRAYGPYWPAGSTYRTGVGFNVDLLFELPTIATAGDVMELGWSVGPGVLLGIGEPFAVGAMGVLGLEFNFIPVPIDLVIEYRPTLYLTPGPGFDPVNFGGHVRIYFN